MRSSNIFMTGNWENLIMSTYQVDRKILEPYLPKNTEIDLYKGKALASIVAFTFSKVKFFGIKVPFHQKFGQINFRFYVKSTINGTKGVVFIKEFAPKTLIALTANIFYNEPYKYKNISHKTKRNNNKLEVTYQHRQTRLKVKSSLETIKLKQNSINHFVVDRYVAFIKNRKQKTVEYKINHKPWKPYKLKSLVVNNDILKLLPIEFKNLKHIAACFVDGSHVSVEKGTHQ